MNDACVIVRIFNTYSGKSFAIDFLDTSICIGFFSLFYLNCFLGDVNENQFETLTNFITPQTIKRENNTHRL